MEIFRMTFGKFRTFQLASIYSHLRDFQVLGLGLALGKTFIVVLRAHAEFLSLRRWRFAYVLLP